MGVWCTKEKSTRVEREETPGEELKSDRSLFRNEGKGCRKYKLWAFLLSRFVSNIPDK